MDSTAMALILLGVLLVAFVGVTYLVVGTKTGGRLATDKYQAAWLTIQHSLEQHNAASWQLAVMNADKLLDQALRERHVRGKTMGERMKAADKQWHNANQLWAAHKVRNQLAHETNATITYDTAVRSLAAFRQGLKDLGAI